MQLRFLDYFVVLAREQHFARAAEACHVAQPTLSAGIVALEEMLGRRLVIRDRRFVGLTAEGHAILPWAQQMLADHEGLRHAIALETGALAGELRLGVIPASMPAVGRLADYIRSANPRVTIAVKSMTSRQIERALHDFELDAGLTYLDNEPLAQVRTVPLYAEHYLFATAAPIEAISWAEAARAELCLLHQGMQNRRILDAHLASLGLSVEPRATADSYVSLLAMVAGAGLSSILPHSYRSLAPAESGVRLIEFSDPGPTTMIGLVASDRDPPSPLARVALRAAAELGEQAIF